MAFNPSASMERLKNQLPARDYYAIMERLKSMSLQRREEFAQAMAKERQIRQDTRRQNRLQSPTNLTFP